MTKKGRTFVWGDEQQKAFDEIKSRLLKAPVLSMPDKRGRVLLYSDTSKYATGSALYQVQDGKPKLIAYVSKRMLEAARNYSSTELEMCGLAINIASFAHLLKRVDFDTVVDHLAIMPHDEKQDGTCYQQNKNVTGDSEFLFLQFILYKGQRHDTE